MKTIKFVAAAFMAFFTAVQASAEHVVLVTTPSGESTSFALAEYPKVWLTSSALVLSASGTTVEYPLTESCRFEIVESTGISTVNPTDNEVSFSVQQSIVGNGLRPGSGVAVYAVSGQLVSRATADAAGHVEIALPEGRGAFIVKSESRTFKFINNK